MKRDNIIFDIIEKEHQRQLKGIELIASENFAEITEEPDYDAAVEAVKAL